MFSRIRYAAHVLSSSPVNPYEHAGIAFVEEKPVRITRVALAIGSFIEITIVSFIVALVASPLVTRVWPGKQVAGVNSLTAFVASMLGLLGYIFFERFKSEIASRLRIGQRIAPYFGHKITDAIRILRG